MSIFDVAGSAMAAQSQRMNVTASNLANADSAVAPNGQPYRAKQVIFEMAPTPARMGAAATGRVRGRAPATHVEKLMMGSC